MPIISEASELGLSNLKVLTPEHICDAGGCLLNMKRECFVSLRFRGHDSHAEAAIRVGFSGALD
jgi:hypothetical protein